jgi:hypothetical protein
VLDTAQNIALMGAKKIRIGGWVDKKLKAEFLKQRLPGNQPKGARPSQSKLFEALLLESIQRRRNSKRKRVAPET